MAVPADVGQRVNAGRKPVFADLWEGSHLTLCSLAGISLSTHPMIESPPGSDLVPPDEEAPSRPGFDAALVDLRVDLFAYLFRQLGDRETAADLTQEAMLRMMKYRDAPGVDGHRYLLFHIARNLVFEHRRTQGRRHAAQHVSIDDVAPLHAGQPSVESIVDARMAIERLIKRVILRLPPKCALAFALNRVHGLSYPQIAKEMKISVKAVEKHIARALVACRAEVGDRDFWAS